MGQKKLWCKQERKCPLTLMLSKPQTMYKILSLFSTVKTPFLHPHTHSSLRLIIFLTSFPNLKLEIILGGISEPSLLKKAVFKKNKKESHIQSPEFL